MACDLKVFGYINMMREFYTKMKSRGRGVIVNIIGNAGNQTPADYAAGVSADAMLEVLTRALLQIAAFMHDGRKFHRAHHESIQAPSL